MAESNRGLPPRPEPHWTNGVTEGAWEPEVKAPWQLIETYDDDQWHFRGVLVSDGERVYLGRFDDEDGWHDATNPDHADEPLNPQPTHFIPLPTPPQAEGGE